MCNSIISCDNEDRYTEEVNYDIKYFNYNIMVVEWNIFILKEWHLIFFICSLKFAAQRL